MGLLGKFLNRLSDERPDLAQQLLTRQIGPLVGYVSANGCGCVVATVAIAAGFVPDGDCDFDTSNRHVIQFLGEALGWDPDACDATAMRVMRISERLAGENQFGFPITTRRSDAITVHLVRQRIAVRLAMAGVA